MSEILDRLRELNPGLPLCSVMDPAFAPYGRVLGGAAEELAAALEKTEIPETGNAYVASDPGLEAVGLMSRLRRKVYGEMDIQAGFCNGNGDTLNAMEYHRCSELNFTTTGLVLLLALPEQLKDGILQSSEVHGFYLPAGILIEIFPRVLHFAPCRITECGFRCLVVLEAGTNEALDSANPAAEGEEKMLWMRNKWMTCHPDSPQREKGAFVGIRGENLTLKI